MTCKKHDDIEKRLSRIEFLLYVALGAIVGTQGLDQFGSPLWLDMLIIVCIPVITICVAYIVFEYFHLKKTRKHPPTTTKKHTPEVCYDDK